MQEAVSFAGEKGEQPLGSGEVARHLAVGLARARRGTAGESAEVAQQVRLIEVAGGEGGVDAGAALGSVDLDQRRLQPDDAGIQFGPDTQAGYEGALQLASRAAKLGRDLVDADSAAPFAASRFCRLCWFSVNRSGGVDRGTEAVW